MPRVSAKLRRVLAYIRWQEEAAHPPVCRAWYRLAFSLVYSAAHGEPAVYEDASRLLFSSRYGRKILEAQSDYEKFIAIGRYPPKKSPARESSHETRKRAAAGAD